MAFETLIAVPELHRLLAGPNPPLLLDCSFDLADPSRGEHMYREGHLPGAFHAHLDRDLAAPPRGDDGRHPLPGRTQLADWLRRRGLAAGRQVVCYDASGAAWAARAWWLLKWLGHAEVAVLDGGTPAWVAAGHALETAVPPLPAPGDFAPRSPLVPAPVDAADVLANIAAPTAQVLDARDPSRFRGEPNPIDPVAGHIPGARSRFFRDNLTPEGRFRPAAELRAEFEALLAGRPAVLQCGSGVTACHNALAMAVAGLAPGRLYPGSWSEWISDPARPVATGDAIP